VFEIKIEINIEINIGSKLISKPTSTLSSKPSIRLPSLEGWLQGLRGRLRGVEAWLQLVFVCLRGGFKDSTFPFEVGEDGSFTIEGDRLLIEKG